jgi:adenylate cyclase
VGWSIPLAIAGFLALLAVALLAPTMPGLLRIDHSRVDLRTALLSHRTAKEHDKVAIVSITDDTLRPYAVQSPIDRDLIADIVRAVGAAGARAIGIDIFFIRATDPAKDQRLKDAIKSSPIPVVLGALDERSEALPEQREFQRRFHAEVERKAGYLNLRTDPDGVVRYTASPAAKTIFPQSFVELLAQTVDPSARQGARRIAWLQRTARTGLLSKVITLDGSSPFRSVLAHELLKSGGPAFSEALQGKVVLIGAERPYLDRHRTPLNAWRGLDMPGVQIHAQMLAEVLDKRRITELTTGSAQVLLVVIGLLGMLAGWRFRSRRFDFLGWGIASVLLIAIDALVFSLMHISLPFLLTVGAWFAGVTAGHHSGHVLDWLGERRSVVS